MEKKSRRGESFYFPPWVKKGKKSNLGVDFGMYLIRKENS